MLKDRVSARPAKSSCAGSGASLRACLGRFATGVAIVTFDGPDGRRGLTVNSFTSVSLDPPLVLVSVAKRARAHALLADRPFTINVLGAEQEALARRFAGGRDELDVGWADGGVAPRLSGVLAYIECRPWRVYDGGDHSLFIGEVVHFDYRDGDALAYVKSGFTSIAEQELGFEHLI